MIDITFVTGNQSKADHLAKYLGFPLKHQKFDLVEIQTLELREVVEHKVKQAYELVKGPVIVEDISLEFAALRRLPGTFIKWFIEELEFEQICSILEGKDRSATAKCVYGYYDGKRLEFFQGELRGTIAEKPAGEQGFGWDKIFIPDGFSITKAQLGTDDYEKTYLILRPFAELKRFLGSL